MVLVQRLYATKPGVLPAFLDAGLYSLIWLEFSSPLYNHVTLRAIKCDDLALIFQIDINQLWKTINPEDGEGWCSRISANGQSETRLWVWQTMIIGVCVMVTSNDDDSPSRCAVFRRGNVLSNHFSYTFSELYGLDSNSITFLPLLETSVYRFNGKYFKMFLKLESLVSIFVKWCLFVKKRKRTKKIKV